VKGRELSCAVPPVICLLVVAGHPSSATTPVVLTAALPAIAAVELPRGDPPKPAARRINVADFGACLADDEHDDTPAVTAAIKAATNNCTLYSPPARIT